MCLIVTYTCIYVYMYFLCINQVLLKLFVMWKWQNTIIHFIKFHQQSWWSVKFFKKQVLICCFFFFGCFCYLWSGIVCSHSFINLWGIKINQQNNNHSYYFSPSMATLGLRLRNLKHFCRCFQDCLNLCCWYEISDCFLVCAVKNFLLISSVLI